MKTQKRRLWIAGALIAVIVTLLTAYVFKSAPTTFAVPMPVPNGYDDFQTAIKLQAEVSPYTFYAPNDPEFSLEQARKQVADSRPVLERVESGLTKSTAVPVAFTTNWLYGHNSTLAGQKRLAWMLATTGYVAEADGRLHEAAHRYLQCLNFGSAVGRGGLIIDTLVSVADERIALSRIEPLIAKLDAADCRFVLRELNVWKTNREPFELAADREAKWAEVFARLQWGALRAAMYHISEMIATKSLHPTAQVIAKSKAKHTMVLDIEQALEVRLAARAFELEHKSVAKGWSDLVPEYLPAIPTNSATGRPLTHQF